MRTSLRFKEELKDVKKVSHKRRDDHIKMEIFFNSDSSPTRTPGPLRVQIDVQDAYGVGFERSGYG